VGWWGWWGGGLVGAAAPHPPTPKPPTPNPQSPIISPNLLLFLKIYLFLNKNNI